MDFGCIKKWVSSCNDFRSAVLCGLLSAFLIFSCGFLQYGLLFGSLSVFSGLPLFFSFLSYGKNDGIVSCAVVFVIVACVCGHEIVLTEALNDIIPAAVLGVCATKKIVKKNKTWWYPESFLLLYLILLSSISTVVMSYTMFSEEKMAVLCSAVIDKLFVGAGLKTEAALVTEQIKPIMKYFAGFSIFIQMLAIISNLQIAQIISRKFKHNIRPRFDYCNITIPCLLAISPIILLTIAEIFPSISYLGHGLSVVLLFAPMASGLSLIHFYADHTKRNGLLASFYILLLFFALPMLLIAAILGVIDSFRPLRPLIASK